MVDPPWRLAVLGLNIVRRAPSIQIEGARNRLYYSIVYYGKVGEAGGIVHFWMHGRLMNSSLSGSGGIHPIAPTVYLTGGRVITLRLRDELPETVPSGWLSSSANLAFEYPFAVGEDLSGLEGAHAEVKVSGVSQWRPRKYKLRVTQEMNA